MKLPLKVIDFFCGCGGIGLGFKQAGFTISAAYDFDKYAVASYNANIGDHAMLVDIRTIPGPAKSYADVWTFGFPCQDISVAGNQAGLDGERSGLFFDIMRLLKITREQAPHNLPKVILAENVEQLKDLLGRLEHEYKAVGYRMKYVLYNSKYWGIPQSRKRYFVIGIRDDLPFDFAFPTEQHGFIPKLSSVLESNIPEKYYLPKERADLCILEAAKKAGMGEIMVAGDLNHYGNDQMNRVYDPEGVSPTVLTCSGGGRHIKIIEKLQAAWTDKDDCAYACTATYYKGLNFTHVASAQRTGIIEPGFRIRRLTPREYFRLQGFPDDYKFVVSDSQLYKQAGNAVSVPPIKAIAESIGRYLAK